MRGGLLMKKDKILRANEVLHEIIRGIFRRISVVSNEWSLTVEKTVNC